MPLALVNGKSARFLSRAFARPPGVVALPDAADIWPAEVMAPVFFTVNPGSAISLPLNETFVALMSDVMLVVALDVSHVVLAPMALFRPLELKSKMFVQ